MSNKPLMESTLKTVYELLNSVFHDHHAEIKNFANTLSEKENIHIDISPRPVNKKYKPKTNGLPIDIKDFQKNLNVQLDEEELSAIINDATRYFEDVYSIALINRLVTLKYSDWPEYKEIIDYLDPIKELNLRVRPVISDFIIRYLPEDQKETILWPELNSFYYNTCGINGLEPNILFKGDLPALSTKFKYPLVITYTAGFGTTHEAIPLLIKHGLGELVTYMIKYPNLSIGACAEKSGATALWAPYKRIKNV